MDHGEEEWIKITLLEYYNKECISKVLSMKSESAVPKGVNFGSQIVRVKMKVVKTNGELEDKIVICKAMESCNLALKESGVFLTEIKTYTEVFPAFGRILRWKGDHCEDTLWAECYGTRLEKPILLLEDLSALGYKIRSKRLGLDLDHTYLVLKSLAKFHALGAVAIENGDVDKSDYGWFYYTNMPDIFCGYLAELAKRIQTHWSEDWVRFGKKLVTFGETFTDSLRKAFDVNEAEFNTINRGDCWVNNIMFRYNDNGDPRCIKFVDFQLTLYNGPGYDLQHFLNTSTESSLYDRNPHLIRFYSDHLQSYLKHFGYKSSIPSYQDVLRSYNKMNVYGLAVALVYRSCMQLPKESNKDGSLLVTFDYDGEQFISAIKHALVQAEKEGILL